MNANISYDISKLFDTIHGNHDRAKIASSSVKRLREFFEKFKEYENHRRTRGYQMIEEIISRLEKYADEQKLFWVDNIDAEICMTAFDAWYQEIDIDKFSKWLNMTVQETWGYVMLSEKNPDLLQRMLDRNFDNIAEVKTEIVKQQQYEWAAAVRDIEKFLDTQK